jgi:hypothetical protein
MDDEALAETLEFRFAPVNSRDPPLTRKQPVRSQVFSAGGLLIFGSLAGLTETYSILISLTRRPGSL